MITVKLPMNDQNIFQYTQSIIAIIVVLGGGITVVLRPDIKDSIIGILGVVVGFYFGGMVQNRNNQQVRSQETTKTEIKS
jgi:hypothetical protein